ncbi:vacuolar protein-sorting-associated protein 36 [Trichonephila inaurata madagascariensis]|uniref:Vacuolar protein-sorting-associated protein 36 n=1 Tax=Trichonephila inaurata madagascariensis TaxID=2747483 RepID=A0A8X6I971_9ARAC|nr:vacuolar protein-sorting-associated protein 36 [Trichonephila inaurata madagascariensis]
MDRFQWWENIVIPGETEILGQGSVKLYDGNKKTVFETGYLTLSSHRLRWKDDINPNTDMSLNLSQIVLVEKESATWTKSAKIIAHLSAILEEDKKPGPVKYSPFNYVKFSFRGGGDKEFFNALSDAIAKKAWEDPSAAYPKGKQYRAGIVGIERQIRDRNEATGETISEAFEDLKNLMKMAKEMVNLSKSVSQKLREKQSDITEDETIQFKSYLLSLGINDPVTKSEYGSGSTFHFELARQLSETLFKPLKEAGGILSLTEVYCRVNRARGVELISPEDLLNACLMLDKLTGPVKLYKFDSGVMVLRLKSYDAVREACKVKEILQEKGSLTADELSVITKATLVIAKERLLFLEKEGIACRDDSIEGLRFYPNRFLTEAA